MAPWKKLLSISANLGKYEKEEKQKYKQYVKLEKQSIQLRSKPESEVYEDLLLWRKRSMRRSSKKKKAPLPQPVEYAYEEYVDHSSANNVVVINDDLRDKFTGYENPVSYENIYAVVYPPKFEVEEPKIPHRNKQKPEGVSQKQTLRVSVDDQPDISISEEYYDCQENLATPSPLQKFATPTGDIKPPLESHVKTAPDSTGGHRDTKDNYYNTPEASYDNYAYIEEDQEDYYEELDDHRLYNHYSNGSFGSEDDSRWQPSNVRFCEMSGDEDDQQTFEGESYENIINRRIQMVPETEKYSLMQEMVSLEHQRSIPGETEVGKVFEFSGSGTYVDPNGEDFGFENGGKNEEILTARNLLAQAKNTPLIEIMEGEHESTNSRETKNARDFGQEETHPPETQAQTQKERTARNRNPHLSPSSSFHLIDNYSAFLKDPMSVMTPRSSKTENPNPSFQQKENGEDLGDTVDYVNVQFTPEVEKSPENMKKSSVKKENQPKLNLSQLKWNKNENAMVSREESPESVKKSSAKKASPLAQPKLNLSRLKWNKALPKNEEVESETVSKEESPESGKSPIAQSKLNLSLLKWNKAVPKNAEVERPKEVPPESEKKSSGNRENHVAQPKLNLPTLKWNKVPPKNEEAENEMIHKEESPESVKVSSGKRESPIAQPKLNSPRLKWNKVLPKKEETESEMVFKEALPESMQSSAKGESPLAQPKLNLPRLKSTEALPKNEDVESEMIIYNEESPESVKVPSGKRESPIAQPKLNSPRLKWNKALPKKEEVESEMIFKEASPESVQSSAKTESPSAQPKINFPPLKWDKGLHKTENVLEFESNDEAIAENSKSEEWESQPEQAISKGLLEESARRSPSGPGDTKRIFLAGKSRLDANTEVNDEAIAENSKSEEWESHPEQTIFKGLPEESARRSPSGPGDTKRNFLAGKSRLDANAEVNEEDQNKENSWETSELFNGLPIEPEQLDQNGLSLSEQEFLENKSKVKHEDLKIPWETKPSTRYFTKSKTPKGEFVHPRKPKRNSLEHAQTPHNSEADPHEVFEEVQLTNENEKASIETFNEFWKTTPPYFGGKAFGNAGVPWGTKPEELGQSETSSNTDGVPAGTNEISRHEKTVEVVQSSSGADENSPKVKNLGGVFNFSDRPGDEGVDRSKEVKETLEFSFEEESDDPDDDLVQSNPGFGRTLNGFLGGAKDVEGGVVRSNELKQRTSESSLEEKSGFSDESVPSKPGFGSNSQNISAFGFLSRSGNARGVRSLVVSEEKPVTRDELVQSRPGFDNNLQSGGSLDDSVDAVDEKELENSLEEKYVISDELVKSNPGFDNKSQSVQAPNGASAFLGEPKDAIHSEKLSLEENKLTQRSPRFNKNSQNTKARQKSFNPDEEVHGRPGFDRNSHSVKALNRHFEILSVQKDAEGPVTRPRKLEGLSQQTHYVNVQNRSSFGPNLTEPDLDEAEKSTASPQMKFARKDLKVEMPKPNSDEHSLFVTETENVDENEFEENTDDPHQQLQQSKEEVETNSEDKDNGMKGKVEPSFAILEKEDNNEAVLLEGNYRILRGFDVAKEEGIVYHNLHNTDPSRKTKIPKKVSFRVDEGAKVVSPVIFDEGPSKYIPAHSPTEEDVHIKKSAALEAITKRLEKTPSLHSIRSAEAGKPQPNFATFPRRNSNLPRPDQELSRLQEVLSCISDLVSVDDQVSAMEGISNRMKERIDRFDRAGLQGEYSELLQIMFRSVRIVTGLECGFDSNLLARQQTVLDEIRNSITTLNSK